MKELSRGTAYFRDMEKREGTKAAERDVLQYFSFYRGLLNESKEIWPALALFGSDHLLRLNGKHRVCLAMFQGRHWISCHVLSVNDVSCWRIRMQTKRDRQLPEKGEDVSDIAEVLDEAR